jgi:hypothetical protein
MILVTNYNKRTAKDGREFVTIELQGGLELIQSAATGKHYACVRKTSVVSTFDEAIAKTLIGTQIPGKIVRKECEEYSYTIQSTGEVITLMHTWEYQPEHRNVAQMQPSI